jgi:GNAT superfamily N-acetyltransferase
MSFTVKPLNQQTWPAYAALIERHGGVWGGCWCMEFHPEGKARGAHRQERKACRVREGTAHASLVFAGELCVGWCQFGPPDELPRIKHRRAYEQVVQAPADWRITCFFVDKAHRGQGVAAAALAGALDLMAALGGGSVESYPEHLAGRRVSASFLHNGGLAMFERQGFQRVAPLGKHHWLVARAVAPKA